MGRSDSSTASEEDEQPLECCCVHDDFEPEPLLWRTHGPYLAPSRWRRYRFPTPEAPEEMPLLPDTLLSGAALQMAVREAVSRLGAGIAASTDMELDVETMLLARVQAVLAALAAHCRGDVTALLAAAAAACAVRPLTSYADLVE